MIVTQISMVSSQKFNSFLFIINQYILYKKGQKGVWNKTTVDVNQTDQVMATLLPHWTHISQTLD